jgi:hypothetical protein
MRVLERAATRRLLGRTAASWRTTADGTLDAQVVAVGGNQQPPFMYRVNEFDEARGDCAPFRLTMSAIGSLGRVAGGNNIGMQLTRSLVLVLGAYPTVTFPTRRFGPGARGPPTARAVRTAVKCNSRARVPTGASESSFCIQQHEGLQFASWFGNGEDLMASLSVNMAVSPHPPVTAATCSTRRVNRAYIWGPGTHLVCMSHI